MQSLSSGLRMMCWSKQIFLATYTNTHGRGWDESGSVMKIYWGDAGQSFTLFSAVTIYSEWMHLNMFKKYSTFQTCTSNLVPQPGLMYDRNDIIIIVSMLNM